MHLDMLIMRQGVHLYKLLWVVCALLLYSKPSCNCLPNGIFVHAAAQAGLMPPGPFGFGGGFGAGGFGGPFMQSPFGMGLSMPAEGMYEQNGSHDISYSNGMAYDKDSAQIRRDKARGRHMPY